MNRQWAVLIVVAGLAVGPSRSFAQSATTGTIAGVVRDATGAVLPGVTVEAASPALIEKARSVVTDSGGQYKVIDLRPGLYSVTFTLPGFGTYKRDALDLSAGFTATVNAELKVGALEETVTVTGASPVVDIQNTRSQSVLRSEVLDALPAGTKSMAGLASLTLGAIPSRPGVNDVGGDKGEQSATIIMHGGRLDDSRVNYDGMNTNVFFANGGGRTYYFNTVAVQEVVIDTGGSSAETETGGASVNMVPKEGGNGLKLYATASYTDSRFAAKSISDDLAARGVGPQSSVKSIYDHGFSLGGPISRDRLWVLGTSRWWGAQQFGANNFYNKSTNPYTYVPDASRPAFADNYFVDSSLRLTWQATGKHKFSQAGHLQHGCSCQLAIGSGANVAPEAATDFDYGPQVLSQTSWSYPATNKLLFQAGAQFLNQNVSFVNGVLSNSSKLTGSGEPVWPGPSNFSILELTTGYTFGAMAGSVTNYGEKDDSSNFNQRFSVSYVTGSHAFKTGLQTLQGRYDINGMQVPNQVTYQFRAGAPASLIQWAGPFVSRMRLSGVALYAQDQWTVKRVTLNVGVRFDRFEGHTLPIELPAGPFIAARPVGALEGLPDYKDITPRVGVAYDLFGTGKTALKGSFGRYLYGQAGGLSLLYAPSLAIVQSVSRTWNDVNGNFVPDCVLTESATNGECGPISNRAFGQPITNSTIAADAVQGWGHRTYNYQTSIQLQHELAPGVGLFAGYFRTWWGNLTVTQNTLVSPSDFTPYCITSPSDARLGDYSGKSTCGFYDVNPDKFGQVNRVTTRASNFGEPAEVYNGIDVGFNARFGQGALLSGGVGVGRQSVDYCYANGRPDLTPENFPANYPRSAEYCTVTSSWWNGIGSQVKLQAIYPLPMGFVVSGTFKNMPGLAQQANLVLGNAQVAGSLGRSLSACPATGTCTATVTAALLPQGSNSSFPVAATLYDERINQIDMRLTKGVRIGRGRVQGMLDVYNLLNDRPPQSLNATYGAAWLRPLTILGGRLLKFGAQLDF